MPRKVLLDVLQVSGRRLFPNFPATSSLLLPDFDPLALSKEDLPKEISEGSSRQRTRLEGVTRRPKFPDYAGGFVDGSGNEDGIGSVDSVEVITLEETDSVGFWETVEERDEAVFVVNL